MPKVKKGRRYKKTYNEDLMQKALYEIRQNGSIRTISSKYGIPRSTLQYRLSTNFRKAVCGPSPVLTLEEEKNIKLWILTCEKTGFSVDKEAVRATVKRLLDKTNRNTIFKNNCPGNGWYRAFLRRHPELFPTGLDGFRRSNRISGGKNWLEHIYAYLKAEGLESILNDPQRVYKADETNFHLCAKSGKILAQEPEGTDPKTMISVMNMFSAAGKCTPPVLVFPCRRMLMEIRQLLPNKWGAGLSSLGYVNSNIIYDYISCILHPNLVQDKVKLPVILFVEGRTANLSYELFDLCSKLKIIPLSLSPNSGTSRSRFSQPQDINYSFRPLKSGCARAMAKRRSKCANGVITTGQLLPVLQTVVTTMTPAVIKAGLETDGIFPLSLNAKKLVKPSGNNDQLPNRKMPESIIKSPESPPVLEFEKFKKLLGPERLKKLQSGNVVNESPDFLVLQKIYNHFARIDILLEDQEVKSCLNKQSNGNDESEGHIVAEHISLPELIKTEPLDLEFENDYGEVNLNGDLQETLYQEVTEEDLMKNLEVPIKTEYSD